LTKPALCALIAYQGFDTSNGFCADSFDRIYKVRFAVENIRVLNAVILSGCAFKIDIEAKTMKSKVAH